MQQTPTDDGFLAQLLMDFLTALQYCTILAAISRRVHAPQPGKATYA